VPATAIRPQCWRRCAGTMAWEVIVPLGKVAPGERAGASSGW
jgi:hypothetical protein